MKDAWYVDFNFEIMERLKGITIWNNYTPPMVFMVISVSSMSDHS